MSIFKKIGGFLKKAAGPLLGFGASLIPGVGPAISSAVGGLFGAKQGAETFPVRSEGDPPPNTGLDWGKTISAAMPAVVGGLNYFGQQQTNAANAQQAQKQMDFQEQMANTSYQRGTQDMKAAGINPMLAYAQGGASSPSGSQAQMGNELGSGANSAFSALQTMQEMQARTAQIDQINAQVGLTHAQTDTERARRSDILEGIPTHGTNRNYTGSRDTGQRITNATDQLRQNLLLDTYYDQVKKEHWSAKGAEATSKYTTAGIGEREARSKLAPRMFDPVVEGMDTISSAKQWLAEHLGGYAADASDYANNKIRDYQEWRKARGKRH